MPAVAANASPAAAPRLASHRTKVTLACNACRRRRVKCNGAIPCSLCSTHAYDCVFDDKNRGRRGPRPRPRRQQEQKIFHKLAPAAPSASSTTTSTIPALAVQSLREQTPPAPPAAEAPRRQSHATDGSLVQRAHPPARRTVSAGALPGFVEEAVEMSEEEEEDGDSGNEQQEDTSVSGKIPSVDTWKHGLELLIASNEASRTGHPFLKLGFLCHLIELFYRHSSRPLQEVVPASYFFPALIAGHLDQKLAFALCAYSVRFSAHAAAQAAPVNGLRVDEYLAQMARKSIDLHGLGTLREHLLQARAICVLLEYEASQSCGRSAWILIATAKALIETYRDDTAFSAEDAPAVASLELFLTIVQYTHTLGQPSLQRGLPTSNLDSDTQYSLDNTSRGLLRTLRLLVRTQQFCSEPLSKQAPPPWSAGSNFGILQKELEEQILRHPGLSSTISTEQGGANDVEICMSLVLSHCCRIVLNKPFLPIPDHHNSNDASNVSDGRTAEAGTHCFNFPGAPSLFLMERARRCEASAVTICSATQHLITTGNFFGYLPLVGFACVQSALVFINYLHRAAKSPDCKLVERLKFLFVVLAAVKKFYEPAQDWLMTLFRAHNTQTPMAPDCGSAEGNAFDSYFSRFLHLKEPSFVPFNPPYSRGQQSQGSMEEVASMDKRTSEKELLSPQPSSWVHTYSGHLFEEMDSNIDAEEERSRALPEAPEAPEAQNTRSSGNAENAEDRSSHTAPKQQPECWPEDKQPALPEPRRQRRHSNVPGPDGSMPPPVNPDLGQEGSVPEYEAATAPTSIMDDHRNPEIEMAWSALTGNNGDVFPPAPQYAEELSGLDPMDLLTGGVFYPLPLFDIGPEMWTSVMLNGGPLPGG